MDKRKKNSLRVVLVMGLALAGTAFAQRGQGHHPDFTPEQRAAMHTAMTTCAQTAGLPALPTPPSGSTDPKEHFEVMKNYEQSLTPAQKEQFQNCRKQAMQKAKAS